MLAHNAKALDVRILLCSSQAVGQAARLENCVAFVDTLPLLKSILPGKPSYSLPKLYLDVVGSEFEAHNSSADVTALEKVLCIAGPVSEDIFLRHSFIVSSALAHYRYLEERVERLQLLKAKLVPKVITLSMATKIAGSGLRYEHLLLAHRRLQCGLTALRSMLVEKIGDGKKVRVTSRSAIIQSLHDHFEGLPQLAPVVSS